MSYQCTTCQNSGSQNEKKSSKITLFKATNGSEVVVCHECLNKLHAEVNNEKVPKATLLHKTPLEIYSHLNRKAVGQDQVKKAVASALSRHYKKIKDPSIKKTNVIITGPSGSGKTYIAKIASEIIDSPFVAYSATELTPNGYEGDSFTSIFKTLLASCDGDVAKAQKGIVFIDEIDKLTKNYSKESGLGMTVQAQLLTIIEGTTLNLATKGKDGVNIMFDTRDITFFLAGACEGIDKVVSKTDSVIGIAPSPAPLTPPTNLEITPSVLIQYGFLRELVGRMSIVCRTKELTRDELITLMTSVEENPLDNQRKILAIDDIQVSFADEYINQIVDLALEMKTGARGLELEIERSLQTLHFNPLQYKNKSIRICKNGEVEVLGKAEVTTTEKKKAALVCV